MEIQGKYITAKIYADEIEKSNEGIIKAFCDSLVAENTELILMPDTHAGKGCSIGTVLKLADKVCPSMVGPDGGCGVLGIKLKIKRLSLEQIDKVVKENIPAGQRGRGKPLDSEVATQVLNSLHCKDYNRNKARSVVGTLGGGNHFISIENDSDGYNWLLIHSGSRSLGAVVEKYWHDIAYEKTKDIVPYELAFLEGNDKEAYFKDMLLLNKFAKENRHQIAKQILKEIKATEYDEIDVPHNYIDVERNILRKGAISAANGERVFIPLNMRDGTLLCTGKGNKEWFESAPHGAGRLYARSEMKDKFTTSQFKQEMKGIYSSTVSPKTLDESPMAYKPQEYIKEKIQPTVEIIDQLKPIYNFKAEE